MARVGSTWVGTHEEPLGSNEGAAVATFCEAVGLSDGYAWCGCFTGYCLEEAGSEVPAVRSAWALDYAHQARRGIVLEPETVARGLVRPKAGWILVWDRKSGGHVGLVARDWTGRCGPTIEGNVSNRVRRMRRCIRAQSGDHHVEGVVVTY